MSAAPELEQQGRLEAITNLCHALGFNETSTEAWLAAWFADLDCLRELAKQAGSQRVQEVFAPESTVVREVLRMWMGYGRHDDEREPLIFTTDNGTCAAPDINKTDAYSICPPGLNDSPDLEKFWNTLALFWSPSKVTAWRNATRAIDSCANYITFGLHVGAYWDHGMFCLKPIAESGDGTWLTADMCWMPNPYGVVSMSLCSRPSLPSDLASAPNQGKVYNANRRRITSGYRITMTTRDPVEMPLASVDLLELRWVLDRIARLSGVDEKYGHEDWEDENEVDAAATPLPRQNDNSI